MSNAFIFDMDGVIVDSEKTWALHGGDLHDEKFGKELAKYLDSDDMVGLSLPDVYDFLVPLGYKKDKKEFYADYDAMAAVIYGKSHITPHIEKLFKRLKQLEYKIGLVSASPQHWIDWALAKENLKPYFDYILSLHEREDLAHKPKPDGFIEAMRVLQSTPEKTIVLEDSNRGIQSAKASGAFTIGFREHLIEGYSQENADIYANTVEDVIKIVEKRLHIQKSGNTKPY